MIKKLFFQKPLRSVFLKIFKEFDFKTHMQNIIELEKSIVTFLTETKNFVSSNQDWTEKFEKFIKPYAAWKELVNAENDYNNADKDMKQMETNELYHAETFLNTITNCQDWATQYITNQSGDVVKKVNCKTELKKATNIFKKMKSEGNDKGLLFGY